MSIRHKLVSLFKNDVIEFLCEPEDLSVIPVPIPAHKRMPDWWKRISPSVANRMRDGAGAVAMTAKKCQPMQDAMACGFIMPLFADINIRSSDDLRWIAAGNEPAGQAARNHLGPVVEFHSRGQLGERFPGPAIKFINRWTIKTAPGYSTLFVPPLNHLETRFTCLSALVDTDRYVKPVNFPAVWLAGGYDGLVAAGTPLVTAIPIRRVDVPRHARVRAMTAREKAGANLIQFQQQTRRQVYTDELRCPRK